MFFRESWRLTWSVRHKPTDVLVKLYGNAYKLHANHRPVSSGESPASELAVKIVEFVVTLAVR